MRIALEIRIIAPGVYSRFEGTVPVVMDHRARKAYPFPDVDAARDAIRERRGLVRAKPYRARPRQLRPLWAAPRLFDRLEDGRVLSLPEPLHDLRQLNVGDAWL